ncbi:MAG: carboxypeptidase-like regulatory domain-containing protein [Thermoplasmatota archaeon]
MRPILLAASLFVVFLAGCADDPAPAPAGEDDDKFDELDVSDSTGAIRGIVVDSAIVPVAGADIELVGTQETAVTNEEGAFSFDALEPGTYFVSVTKLGYKDAQQSVDVIAGDERPPVAKIRIIEAPEELPQATTQNWDGYLACGAGTPVGSLNPCADAGSENVHNFTVDGVPDYVQIEMVWRGTNVLGDTLSIGMLNPDGLLTNFAGADCTSPCVFRVSGELMEEFLGPDFQEYTIRVFPGSGADGMGASLVVEQGFSVYATEFHRFEPDADWLFVEDGAYPVPR